MREPDLTSQEQAHVRAALQFLRERCGGWAPVAKMLGLKDTSVANVANGQKVVSASVAVRVARMASVGVDELFAGKFPAPGTCPRCGHRAEAP
jgi:hypothetical protein